MTSRSSSETLPKPTPSQTPKPASSGATASAWPRSALLVAATLLALTLLVRLLFLPDPTGNLWQKAGQLERDKLPAQALRVYEMIWRGDPTSTYAPQALQRQADILTAQARRDGDQKTLHQAALLYQQLATTYVESPLSGPAFLTAGGLAMDELRDYKLAGSLYLDLLSRYPNNPDYAAEATVRLGRLAISSGQKERARDLLQRTLQRFPKQTEASAQAQYHLGVLYETLYSNREWAQDAFDATIRRYPTSLWASAARERLGLLAYRDAQGRPRARRVLVRTLPVTQIREGDDLTSAMQPLLAARGLELSDALLEGMTLRPFLAGFSPKNAGAIVKMQAEGALNIAANAGLTAQMHKGGDAVAALQEALDQGRASAVYLAATPVASQATPGQVAANQLDASPTAAGQPAASGWRLCVGYDSSLKQVFLAGANGEIETQDVKTFNAQWSKSRAFNQTRAMLTLFAPGERPQEASGKPFPSATPTKTFMTPRPTPTIPRAEQLQTPTWEFASAPLKPADVLRRTLRRAIILLRRNSDGGALLNGAALNELAKRCEFAAQLPAFDPQVTAQFPVPPSPPQEPTPTFAPDSPLPADDIPTPDAEPTDAPAPLQPEDAPNQSAPNQSAPVQITKPRPKPPLAWFGAPLDAWLQARRDAAEFCDEAANTLKNPDLKKVGDAFRLEIAALETARLLAPTANTDNEAGRAVLRELAKQLRAARFQERRAADAMSHAAL